MNKLWSFLLWVVTAIIVVTTLLAVIEPYIGILVTLIVIVAGVVIGIKVWRYISNRRSHY